MCYTHGCVEGLQQACHDIRQPIAGVLALAGAALTEADLPDNARDRLKQIVRLAEWQSDVIEHWLWTPDTRSSETHPTDVLGVLQETMAAQRTTWAGDLTLLWPSDPVFVRIPAVSIRRMLANLLANATRAAGPSGRVIIEVSPRTMQMLLAVEDDGPGFGRLPKSYGLGLSAVAREAIEHRGRLECGRGSLGGARVSLWLPAVVRGLDGRIADAARAV
jgi:C4-dicarboxylate-specific signal transduction histidine kinase